MSSGAGVGAEKAALRRRVRAAVAALDPELRRTAAAAAAAALVETPELAGAHRVGLFAALADEISTRPLFDALRARGAACFLPRIHPDGGLELAALARWADLVSGPRGVLAPPGAAPAVVLGEGDVLVIPGVAFDAAGGRLGRGAGYYDRLLAALGEPRPHRVGLAYQVQLVDRVPIEGHDQRVQALATECGVRRVVPEADRGEAPGGSSGGPKKPLTGP